MSRLDSGRRLQVAVIAGTRPEAIKVAPVVTALRSDGRFSCTLISTGQHREMLQQAFDLFGLGVDVDLNVMLPGQSLNQLSARVLSAVADPLAEIDPDWVLVQGDTTSAAMGAIAAFQTGLAVGHIEAGLRSFNRRDPYPEEANRRMISVVSDLHFAPTPGAETNLLSEGVASESVIVTGNTVIDASQMILAKSPLPTVGDCETSMKKKVLVTVHRRENHGAPLRSILRAVRQLASLFPDTVEFLVPVHPNPQVRPVVTALLGNVPSVRLVDPLPYSEMVREIAASTLVLTDSGGLQEEAPGLGVPVLILRETTERPEGVAAGTAQLVGTNSERIVASAQELLTNSEAYERMARASNPYGDGNATGRILNALYTWRASDA